MSDQDTRPPAEDSRWLTPDISLGEQLAPGPLGLADPWPWQARHPAAPASRYEVAELPSAQARSVFGKTSRAPATRSRKGTFARRLGKELKGAAGIQDQDQEPSPPETKPSKKAATGALIRDALSPSGLAQIKALMHEPSLALTIPMRDLMAKLGRYGQIGDKGGLRRTVAELADKLNAEAAPHGTVLVEQALAGQLSGTGVPLPTADPGKRTIEATQGGRTLRALAPILAENGTLNWKDGLDRGWQRLNERFALQAQGIVDVVVGRRSSPPPPVDSSESGGVGQWEAPRPGAGVGQWAPPAASESPKEGAAPVGSWSAPVPGTASPVGQWSAPPGAEGGSGGGAGAVGAWDTAPAASSAPVGQWTAPSSSEAGASQPPVGAWAPPAAANADGNPPVGQWSDASPEQAQGNPPVGQWTTPTGAHESGPVGQWLPTSPRGEAAQGPAGDADAKPAVGSWSVATPGSVGGVKISDRMTVADVVRQNPNISSVRIVEYGPPSGTGGGLREVLNIASSVLRKHLGD